MDLSFTRQGGFARTFAGPVRLDAQRLLASLAASQTASATARVEARLAARGPRLATPVDALVRLFAGEPGWARALGLLEGHFHPAVAARLASPRQGT